MDHMDKPWKYTVVRACLAAATFTYLPFVLPAAGMPRWDATWWPSTGGQDAMVFTIIVTLALWADAWLLLPWLARRKLRSSRRGTTNRSKNAALGTFLVRAALLYSGAPAGAGLSFRTHDSRYAIIFATASALLILLLPKAKGAVEQAVAADNPAAGTSV
jgi:hypothetical protein